MKLFPYGVSPVARRLFDRAVHGVVCTVDNLPGIRISNRDFRVKLDEPYRRTGRRAHLLDIVRPADDRRLPAMLYVHGGAFSMLSKDTHRRMAAAYARAGYVVFNINYRLGPRHRYPAQLEDVAAALLWVLDHAAEANADPSHLVLAGESAGANLVTALATMASEPRPEPFAAKVFERAPHIDAVLGIYGVYDLHDMGRFWRDTGRAKRMSHWVKRELRWASHSYVGSAPERAPLASPIRILQDPAPPGSRPLPPFFLTVGTADPLLHDSRALADALTARGVPCELQILPGEIHGFNAMPWRPAAQAKWRAVYAFLQRTTKAA